MKNLLRSTLYLSVFALAGILFQIGCSNSDTQKTTNTISQNKIICTAANQGVQSFWICNYDGTNLTQIPITLPPNVGFDITSEIGNGKLSPDGTKIFFRATNLLNGNNNIYSCDITGNNLQLVTSISAQVFTFDLN